MGEGRSEAGGLSRAAHGASAEGGARWLRCALVVFALLPMLALVARGVTILHPVATLFERVFALHCHRDPSRALALLDHPFPVCARCLGLYAGCGVAAAWSGAVPAEGPRRAWVFAAALAMLLDVAREHSFGGTPVSALRFVTGLALALPIALGLLAALLPRRST